jgi:hypothetical protein
MDLLALPGIDEDNVDPFSAKRRLADVGLSHRTKFSNKDPFGRRVTPLYANRYNTDFLFSGHSRAESDALMRASLRRLGHLPRQPADIGNHEVPAPPRLLIRRKGSGLPPWYVRSELPKIDPTLNVDEIVELYKHQCFFCGVYFA